MSESVILNLAQFPTMIHRVPLFGKDKAFGVYTLNTNAACSNLGTLDIHTSGNAKDVCISAMQPSQVIFGIHSSGHYGSHVIVVSSH